MRRALNFVGLVGLTAFITFLWVAKNQSDGRADHLDKALVNAEARVAALEDEIEAANRRVAQLTENRRLQPVDLRAGVSPESDVTSLRPVDAGTDTSTPNQSGWSSSSGYSRPTPVMVFAGAPPGAEYVTLPGGSSLILISGSSSVRDWNLSGTIISGMVRCESGLPPSSKTGSAYIGTNLSISASVPVRTLKSANKDGASYARQMEEIVYETLLADDYPKLAFTLSRFEWLGTKDSTFGYLATGFASVAGTTNTMTMRVRVEAKSDGRLHFNGLADLKMSDFGIQAPSATVGGIPLVTADEIHLTCSWWVTPAGNLQAGR